jgi:hypothetical protein
VTLVPKTGLLPFLYRFPYYTTRNANWYESLTDMGFSPPQAVVVSTQAVRRLWLWPLPLGLDMLLICCYNTYMSTKKPSRMSIYLPASVQERLKIEAARQHRSMNAQVVWCIEQCLGIQQEERADVPRPARPPR